VGFLSEVSASTEVSAGGVTTKSDAGGVAGFLAYTYFLDRDFGISVSAGVLDADAKTSATGFETLVESASVTPLLFGVKYQPSQLTVGEVLRPYASASIGPYIGSASNVRTGATTATESISEAALGSRLGMGIDLFFGKLFTLGAGVGYHLVSDFDHRIGSEKNHSGPEFALSFGVAFGG
jgi:hypothetical protein